MTEVSEPRVADRLVAGTSFTHRQVRRALVLLPAVLLAAFTLVNLASLLRTPGRIDGAGVPKGHDFVQFYILGTFAIEGRGHALHDAAAMAREIARLVPQAAGDTFLVVYGPQVALFFAPFAALPYELALGVWLALIVGLYSLSAWAMWRRLPALRDQAGVATLLLTASPALHGVLVSGQTSALGLAAVTAFWVAFRSGRPVLAGVALGLLAYKPSLGFMLVAVLLASAEWRVLAAAAATFALQMLASALWFGTGTVGTYLAVLASTPGREELEFVLVSHKHSLRALFTLLTSGHPAGAALYLVSALIVVLLAVWAWRSRASVDVRFALALLATALASPHLFIYDLLVLTPAFLILWHEARQQSGAPERAELALYLVFLAPFAAPLAAVTGVQVSTLALLALFGAVLWSLPTGRSCTRPASEPIQGSA